jgi:hypothetical protein
MFCCLSCFFERYVQSRLFRFVCLCFYLFSCVTSRTAGWLLIKVDIRGPDTKFYFHENQLAVTCSKTQEWTHICKARGTGGGTGTLQVRKSSAPRTVQPPESTLSYCVTNV